jgi:hypothetical protein
MNYFLVKLKMNAKLYIVATFLAICTSNNIYAATSVDYSLPSAALINQIDINYANKKAIYREILTNGLEKIVTVVAQQKLAKNTWGVIFGLDGTLLDDAKVATPGAVELTCKIIKLGGMVSIVTERSGAIANNTDFITQTQNQLDSQGICYSNIVFANNNNDTNKNPRFSAVSSGDYENIFTTKRLPPLQIVGYFGTKIEDFPDLKQNLANTLPVSDNMFSQFGQKYFMLPR